MELTAKLCWLVDWWLCLISYTHLIGFCDSHISAGTWLCSLSCLMTMSLLLYSNVFRKGNLVLKFPYLFGGTSTCLLSFMIYDCSLLVGIGHQPGHTSHCITHHGHEDWLARTSWKGNTNHLVHKSFWNYLSVYSISGNIKSRWLVLRFREKPRELTYLCGSKASDLGDFSSRRKHVICPRWPFVKEETVHLT